MSWAVITADVGGYDRVNRPPPVDDATDLVFVTDSMSTARHAEKLGWRVVVEECAGQAWICSRRPKFHPHLYTDRAASVWVDARVLVTNSRFVQWAENVLGDSEMAAFLHPDRSTIAQEAEACAELGLVDRSAFEQVAVYEAAGLPSSSPLLAGGLLIRRHTDITGSFGEVWRDETMRWRTRDQISLPYAAWRTQLSVTPIPGSIYNASGLRLRPHRHAGLKAQFRDRAALNLDRFQRTRRSSRR